MASTDTIPSAPASITPQAQRVIWLLLGAAFVAILNETTMGVAIDHLIDDLSITASAAQWLTTAFMLTMAVVIPITGFLLRRLTTRVIFVTAMSLFSLGTLVAFLAPGFEVLLVARVIQASGTAIMMPLLMTTLMTVVPAHERGRMMGRVSIVMALAPALGPTLAGVILDTLGWRWIFGVVLPIAIVALVVGALWIRNVGEQSHARIDALSVVLSAFGFGGLVYGLSQIGGEGGAASSPSATLWISLIVGVVALTLLVLRQLRLQRDDRALLDLRVFSYRNFTISLLQFTILSFAFFGAITVLPLYLQRAVGADALTTGLLLLPGSLLMGLTGPLIGAIYDKWGTRVLLIPGALTVIAVLWGLTFVDANTSIWVLLPIITVMFVGLSLSFPPLFTASLGSLPPHLYAYGSAILSTVQQVAGAAGVAVLVTLMATSTANASANGASPNEAWASGTHTAFVFAAAVSILTIVGALMVRKPADTIEMPGVGH